MSKREVSSHGRHNFQKPKNMKGTFRRLAGFLAPYKVALLLVVLFTVLATLFSTLGPFVLGKATDAIASVVLYNVPLEQATAQFIRILVTLGVIYLFNSLFKYWSQYLMAGASQKTMYDLRSAVDNKLKKLPLNYFDTNSYGDILSRVTNDVDTVSNSLQQSMDQLISSVASIVFILIMMIVVSPILTLIGLITVPLSLLVSMQVVKHSQGYFKGQQASLGALNGYVEEMYTGHNVVRAFGKEADSVEEFEKINNELYRNGWKAQFISSIIMPAVQFLSNVGYVGVAVAGGMMVINGGFTIGKIQSFIQYLRQFSMPINQTAQIASILQSTAAAAERIFEFLDETEEIPEATEKLFPQKVEGSVQFEHVKFGYNNDNILIKDLNINIPAGDKVAIVGPTGAGKTTLVNLLLRFYDVKGGAIKIDGVNLMDMGREELRSMFGMVLQDTWLFNGTIKENIAYGRLGATDEEVKQAAKAAHAHSFIKTMPKGYNMELTEGASNLAQGERQLITIARAILSDAPVLILDEATSSVDTRTEVAIQKAMRNLTTGRTSFVIAHRLSTIKDADIILFMSDGDIKETGSHDELMKKDGYYKKLYNSQFAENNEK